MSAQEILRLPGSRPGIVVLERPSVAAIKPTEHEPPEF